MQVFLLIIWYNRLSEKESWNLRKIHWTVREFCMLMHTEVKSTFRCLQLSLSKSSLGFPIISLEPELDSARNIFFNFYSLLLRTFSTKNDNVQKSFPLFLPPASSCKTLAWRLKVSWTINFFYPSVSYTGMEPIIFIITILSRTLVSSNNLDPVNHVIMEIQIQLFCLLI